MQKGLILEAKMGKNKKETWTYTSIVRPFAFCFSVSGEGKHEKTTTKAVSPVAGPEAAMVAAGKHFSSKVRLI